MPEESKEQMKPASASKARMKVKVDQVNQSNQSINQSTNRSTARSSGSGRTTRRVSTNQSTNQTISQSPINSPLGSPKQRSIEEILGFWPHKNQSLLSPNQSINQSTNQSINQSSSSPKQSTNQSVNHLNRYPKVLQYVQENKPHELLSYLQSINQSVNRTLAVQSMDIDGNPMIFHALAPSHSQVLQILLDYGATVQSINQPNNPNAPINQSIYQSTNQSINQKLNTPLHLAVHFGYKKTQQTLIEFGASLKAENWEHQQPYQMAINQSINQSTNQSTNQKSSASDRVQQAQNYLNSLYEAHSEKLAVFASANQSINQSVLVDPLVRGYYRSIFDLCDSPRLNQIPYQIFHQIINQLIDQRSKQHYLENPLPHVRPTIADREKAKELAINQSIALAAINQSSKGKKDAKKPVANQSVNQALTPLPPTTNQIIESFFSLIDSDHNGALNFPEWLMALLQLEQDRENAKKGKTKKTKGSKKGKTKAKK